jgi:hypothetical protein
MAGASALARDSLAERWSESASKPSLMPVPGLTVRLDISRTFRRPQLTPSQLAEAKDAFTKLDGASLTEASNDWLPITTHRPPACHAANLTTLDRDSWQDGSRGSFNMLCDSSLSSVRDAASSVTAPTGSLSAPIRNGKVRPKYRRPVGRTLHSEVVETSAE